MFKKIKKILFEVKGIFASEETAVSKIVSDRMNKVCRSEDNDYIWVLSDQEAVDEIANFILSDNWDSSINHKIEDMKNLKGLTEQDLINHRNYWLFHFLTYEIPEINLKKSMIDYKTCYSVKLHRVCKNNDPVELEDKIIRSNNIECETITADTILDVFAYEYNVTSYLYNKYIPKEQRNVDLVMVVEKMYISNKRKNALKWREW